MNKEAKCIKCESDKLYSVNIPKHFACYDCGIITKYDIEIDETDKCLTPSEEMILDIGIKEIYGQPWMDTK